MNNPELIQLALSVAAQFAFVFTESVMVTLVDYVKDMYEYIVGKPMTGRAIPLVTQLVTITSALAWSLVTGSGWLIAIAVGIIAGVRANKYYDKKKIDGLVIDRANEK